MFMKASDFRFTLNKNISPTQRTSGVTMLTFLILIKWDFSISNSTKNVLDWITQACICKIEKKVTY